MDRLLLAAAVAGLLLGPSTAGAQEMLSFSEALERASEALPPDAVPREIGLYGREQARYEVLFLTRRGTATIALDATNGEVLRRALAEVDPRRGTFAPPASELVRDRSLADAIAIASKPTSAGLHRVALHAFGDRLVLEVQRVEGGELVASLVDLETGEPLGAPEPQLAAADRGAARAPSG